MGTIVKALASVVEKLAETPMLTFVVLFPVGAILLATAATGGWPQYGVPNLEELWRYVLAGSGIVLMSVAIGFGVAAAVSSKRKTIDPRKAGVVIEQPAHSAEVRVPCPVSGVCRKLPRGYKLWAFNIGGKGREFYPQDEVHVHNGRWNTELGSTKFQIGDKWQIALFLVGEDGEALIHHYGAAGRDLNQVPPLVSRHWTPLTVLTSDIVRCTDVCEVTIVGAR